MEKPRIVFSDGRERLEGLRAILKRRGIFSARVRDGFSPYGKADRTRLLDAFLARRRPKNERT